MERRTRLRLREQAARSMDANRAFLKEQIGDPMKNFDASFDNGLTPAFRRDLDQRGASHDRVVSRNA